MDLDLFSWALGSCRLLEAEDATWMTLGGLRWYFACLALGEAAIFSLARPCRHESVAIFDETGLVSVLVIITLAESLVLDGRFGS